MAWNKQDLAYRAEDSSDEDMSVFSSIGLGYRESLSVLDIGCFDGYNTVLKFSPYRSVSRVVGIDNLPEAIASAKDVCEDDRFSYALFDVDEDTIDRLREIAAEAGVEGGFDLVYCAESLHHFKDKARALKLAYEILKPGGWIVVRTVDDDLKCSYPDPEGRMRKVLEFYDKEIRELTPWTYSTDPYYGKKCAGDMLGAGFKDVRLKTYSRSTVGRSLEERLNLFYQCTYFREGDDAYHSMDQARKAARLLKEWKQLFLDENYVFIDQQLIVWANKPGDDSGNQSALSAVRALPLEGSIDPGAQEGAWSDTYRIRAMEERDLNRVVWLEMKTFFDPWSPSAFVSELKYNPQSVFLVAVSHSDLPMGYVGVWIANKVGWIVKIAVGEEMRLKGVGSALLDCATKIALSCGCEKLMLELRESNSVARRFYASLGFAETSKLGDYYQNPLEDAVVMEKGLAGKGLSESGEEE